MSGTFLSLLMQREKDNWKDETYVDGPAPLLLFLRLSPRPKHPLPRLALPHRSLLGRLRLIHGQSCLLLSLLENPLIPPRQPLPPLAPLHSHTLLRRLNLLKLHRGRWTSLEGLLALVSVLLLLARFEGLVSVDQSSKLRLLQRARRDVESGYEISVLWVRVCAPRRRRGGGRR